MNGKISRTFEITTGLCAIGWIVCFSFVFCLVFFREIYFSRTLACKLKSQIRFGLNVRFAVEYLVCILKLYGEYFECKPTPNPVSFDDKMKKKKVETTNGECDT